MPDACVIVCVGKQEMSNSMLSQSEIPESGYSLGFLLCFWVALNQANYRVWLSSNHLQMRWQTTPAVTATVNEMNSSISKPPSCYQYRGGNKSIITLYVVQKNDFFRMQNILSNYLLISISIYKRIRYTKITTNTQGGNCNVS